MEIGCRLMLLLGKILNSLVPTFNKTDPVVNAWFSDKQTDRHFLIVIKPFNRQMIIRNFEKLCLFKMSKLE